MRHGNVSLMQIEQRRPCRRKSIGLTQHQLPGGELVEWLCSGLQIRVHEFDSRTRLHTSCVKLQNARSLTQDVVFALLYTTRTQSEGAFLYDFDTFRFILCLTDT